MDGRSDAGHLTRPDAARVSGPPQRPAIVDGGASARSIARRELLILVVVCLWCFDIALHYDLSASLVDWAHRHRETGLGEVFVLLVAGFLGLSLIAWRRYLHGLGEARELDRTQRALALTTERHRSLFEFHPSAVFSVDFCGRFTATNAACERLTGYDAATLREMTFFDVLARGYVEGTETAFWRALDREPQRLEAAIIHADGHLVELAVTGLPIVVDDVVVGVYAIAEDITEAKRGNAVPFDVRLLVGEVATLMRPLAEHKGLFFKCTVGPGIPELVQGDPAKIAEVLTNLLDNAIEFTESGWVRLIVTSAHHFGDRVSIRFEVHDSGIGVGKDQERRLYLGFSQVAPVTPRTYDGSGLGLAISQQLVTSMGGAIGLSSAPGLGSAFSFTLRFMLPLDDGPD